MIDITDYIDENKKYYIYGTANMGLYCYDKISEKFGDEIILGFIRTNSFGHECTMHKKRIYQPFEIDFNDDNIYVIITSYTYAEDMKQNLRDNGIKDKNIISFDEIAAFFRNGNPYGRKEPIKNVCYWPPIENYDDRLIKKISWFIPDKIEVTVFCKDEIKKEFKKNVVFADIENIDNIFSETDMIFVWTMSSEYPELKEYLNKVYAVDPDFYSVCETTNYAYIYYMSLSQQEKEQFKKKSLKNFINLKNKAECKKYASVFCPGPSVGEIKNLDFSDSFNVICNELVFSDEYIKKLSPSLLTFTDYFFISPIKVIEDFYNTAEECIKKYNMHIVTFEYMVPLILFHYPDLKNNIIGIPDTAHQYVFPDENSFEVKISATVMTVLMIPFASTLFDEINISGCTGMNQNAKEKFWGYDNRIVLDKSEYYSMFPSVYRDNDSTLGYDIYIKNVEELLEYGESVGKKYFNLTTSYIPALEKRYLRRNLK